MTKRKIPINMRDATLPLTYEEALQEIIRLKVKLELTNEKWAKAVEMRERDNRSHSRATRATKGVSYASSTVSGKTEWIKWDEEKD